MRSAHFSPVGLTGGPNLAYSVSVPSQHWREGPDEGEGPNEHKTQDRVLCLQSDVTQRSADHKEPFKGQDSQGPEGHDPLGKQQEVNVVEPSGTFTSDTQQYPRFARGLGKSSCPGADIV